MKWPEFLKFSLPKWKIKLPRFPRSTPSFYRAWKKFIRQVPPESRPLVKSYQHFIVMGGEKKGKTDLIHSLIDQAQDLYPFDTAYQDLSDLQFYIGPRQIIEEISFAALEDRSIKRRKEIIRLWKKLYRKNPPFVVVAYDASSESNLRDSMRLAQLVAGKVSLLTEISSHPIRLRMALTHLDKIPGYLEFARFLKQQNIPFAIPLSSHFESNQLAEYLRNFAEKHLSLILTTVSHGDYTKILQFFKEMPLLFPSLEEFLRALVSHVSFKKRINLDSLSFTSNQEPSSSFSVFQWTQIPQAPLFFRYPMLKHQIGAAALSFASGTLFLNSYFYHREELLHLKRGSELLDLLQLSTFQEQIVHHQSSFQPRSYLLFPPYFFTASIQQEKAHLSQRIRKHILEPAFRKAILENRGEFKYLYFLSLMQSLPHNHLGKFISKNSEEWGKVLGLEPHLVRTYVSIATPPLPSPSLGDIKTSPFLPLTSLQPWHSFLKKIKELTDQPLFIEHPLENEDILKESEKLLTALSRLKEDSLIFAIATLLDEAGFKGNENIQTISWIGENVNALESLLLLIKETSIPRQNVQGMNLLQFFTKLKEMSLLAEGENEVYHFNLYGELFSFDYKKWVDHVAAHQIERAIQEYMATNSDMKGAIFLNQTTDVPEPSLAYFQDSSSLFKTQVLIPSYYSRADFEKKVRTPAEKLIAFVESLPINPEEKKRFSNFLTKEAIEYIKNYQSRYVKLFEDNEVEFDSPKEIKKLLKELSNPSSYFYNFLQAVQYQTSVFSQPILSIPCAAELNEFAFLDALFLSKDGEKPIGQFQELMKELLKEMEAPQKEGTLSSWAQISAAILHRHPHSYMARLEECLKQMGIPESFQTPFRKPLLCVHRIGIQELKKEVEHLWASRLHPKIEALLSQFPFSPQGAKIAAPEDLEALLHPQSSFYQKCVETASKLLQEKEGRWIPLPHSPVPSNAPFLKEMNHLSYLSHLLWSADGKPKPLTLQICSVPFSIGVRHPVPLLSYIVTGEESIYNFNQDPSWQTLSVEWWRQDASYIGMKLFNKVTHAKSYHNLQGPTSFWSFFSLLKQAKEEKGDTWEWTLEGTDAKDRRTVAFRFAQNPYQIFEPQEGL